MTVFFFFPWILMVQKLQAAATVWLLLADDDFELVVDVDAWPPSFLSSCFICCSLHSKLQKAVSPLYT